MKLKLHPATFMIAYVFAYIFVFAMDWPLFRYYPLHRIVNPGWGVLSGMGPGMAWYGLMATAALVALPLAVLVPDSRLLLVLRNRLWLFPVAAMLASVFLLRKFFF